MGAISPGRGHCWQLLARIGSTSLLNVTAAGVAAIAAIPTRQPVNDMRNARIASPPLRMIRPAYVRINCRESNMRVIVLSILGLAALARLSVAAPESGDAVFKQYCAGCHEQNNPRIPTRETLQKMPATRIL